MRSRLSLVATVLVAGIAVLACSSPGASTASQAPASVAPATVAPSVAASEAPSAAPSEAPSAAAAATVEAKPVGSIGTVLVAGSNGMTVYTFTKDTKDSGTSACTGGCLETWPALTVDAGKTPVAGDGVTGKLGTITRADDGTLQVTYNGLPLYFFKNDKAPGDSNGVYENWEAVKP
jgi:predicted lipoprotein with Yx(FWY)xxD motif